jgi:N-acetylglutamate synthase-like GNAT family acetyltransferase
MVDFSDCDDVRLAELQDIPGIIELMRTACKEDAQHPMDEEKVFFQIRRHFEKSGAMLAVIGEIGEPVAYLLCIIDEIWYAPPGTYQLLELSLFVHPDHRKSTYAKQLMKFSKKSSEALKLDLTIGVYSTERTAAKVKLYSRQFETVGAYFRYRPASAESNA